MRTRDVQWGILGAGRIARVFAADLAAAGLRVSAVAARDPARAAWFARETGIPRAHGSYRALVEDPDVDVVYVATPQPFASTVEITGSRAEIVDVGFVPPVPVGLTTV